MRSVHTKAGAKARHVPGLATMGCVLAACVSLTITTSAFPDVAAAALPSGGALTMLESSGIGAWPTGLDPATNTTAGANMTQGDAIFGEMFELGPHGKTIYDLASGAQLSADAKTLTIDVRHGVSFSDGTAFNAAAVAFNLKRDLASKSGDVPAWAVSSIDTPNDYTVVIHLSTPDGAIVDQFQGAIVNWMVSPTALSKMGEKAFSLAPVGAGPFVVTTADVNSKLVLTRNPHYWQAGHPYLAGLTFLTVASDESALESPGQPSPGLRGHGYPNPGQELQGGRTHGHRGAVDRSLLR
jgi:peptide/nickel transport system substrate-binding protein